MKKYSVNVLKTFMFFAIAIFCFSAPVWAGTISGHVQAKGIKSSQWVVVYIDTIAGQKFPPPKEHAINTQVGKEFSPYVQPVLKGTTVDFLNKDPFLHNVFSPDEAADEMNLGTWGQGEKRSHVFNKLGEAVILCNLHPEMEGWIVTLPTPYFAVTDKTGNYTIKNVPEGTYTLKTWHKKLKSSKSEVTVSSNGVSKVDFIIKK